MNFGVLKLKKGWINDSERWFDQAIELQDATEYFSSESSDEEDEANLAEKVGEVQRKKILRSQMELPFLNRAIVAHMKGDLDATNYHLQQAFVNSKKE